MNKLMLFTDGSVNTKTKTGFGAYLLVYENEDYNKTVNDNLKVKMFKDTSSTKLELQTLLWALNDIKDFNREIIIYTDSQNIIGLEKRRKRLEQNKYLTSKNILIRNHELYKSFYSTIDKLDCTFIKVAGHQPNSKKGHIDKLFSIVDKASRIALRKDK